MKFQLLLALIDVASAVTYAILYVVKRLRGFLGFKG